MIFLEYLKHKSKKYILISHTIRQDILFCFIFILSKLMLFSVYIFLTFIAHPKTCKIKKLKGEEEEQKQQSLVYK